MSPRHLIAIEVLMRHDPIDHYDSGEDGIFPECRSCHFHRPYAKDQTCVFRTCPYSAQPTPMCKPTRWILAYVNPSLYYGGDYPERQHHRHRQPEGRRW